MQRRRQCNAFVRRTSFRTASGDASSKMPGSWKRISIIQRGADAWRAINVARHASDGCCSDDELDSLIGLACLMLPMLPLNRKKKAAPLTVEQLEERFAMRYADLTLERATGLRARGERNERRSDGAGAGCREDVRADVPAACVSAARGRRSALELCALVTH